MNSYERIMARLEGKEVDKIPNLNIVMQFAAKYIGVPYGKYCSDYRLLVDGNIRCCEGFGIDAVSAISDPCREAEGFGANVVIGYDSVPEIRGIFINDHDDIKKISCSKSINVPRMADRIKAIELYAKKIKWKYPIIGWVEGPFAEAADLCGVNEAIMDVIIDPEFLRELMSITLEQATSFAWDQVTAGADIIGVGDAVASLIGPEYYKHVVLPYETELLKRIKDMGVKTKLHICGNIEPYLECLPVKYCDIIDIDWMVDMDKAISLYGDSTSFCGNINPVTLLQSSTEEVYTLVKKVIANTNSRYIFAAGCEIPKDTPETNMNLIENILVGLNDKL